MSRRKAHGDWCVKVAYLKEIRSVVSCSPDSKDSIVIASHNNKDSWNVSSISVHKGVQTFAYCHFPAVLATGGAGKIMF